METIKPFGDRIDEKEVDGARGIPHRRPSFSKVEQLD
jgi:hypothetical protein